MEYKIWLSRLLAVAGIYLLFCLIIVAWQRKLIYFPQRLTKSAADDAFAFFRLQRWPDASTHDYRALIHAEGDASGMSKGTVVVFHGNAGGAHERVDYCYALQRFGWRVILAEYPGYAARAGRISETALIDDALETVRLVKRAYPGRLVLFGESLGCGVAAAVAAAPDMAIDALILATPWDTLAKVAARHYPWLPVRLFLLDRYDNVKHLSQYHGSVTIIVAEADEIIPRKHTLALYDSLPPAAHKRLVGIPEAGHNDWFYFVTDAQWREMLPD